MPIPPLGMASYAYTAINSAGLELDGQVNAPDANAAREALRVRGLVALTLAEQASSSAGFAMAVKKVKPKSLQVFSRQFATMIEAGLNVVTALVILEEQTEDKKLASVVSRAPRRRRRRTPALGGDVTPSAHLLSTLHLDGRGG